MKKILVHICCGPCSIYPLKEALKGEYEVAGFFWNPNIQPRAEHDKRLASVKKLSELMNVEVIFGPDYDASAFVRDADGHRIREITKDDRCRHCYTIRLRAVAQAARDNGFDMFSSSLLYSRYQDHEQMRALAKKYAAEFNVEFFYRDFRKGWQEGIKESKEMGLYRQQYCGCIYSWMERYNINQ